MGAHSSMAERPAHNWFVAGSNPAGPICAVYETETIRKSKIRGRGETCETEIKKP